MSGSVKEAAGNVTRDTNTETDGAAENAIGKAQNTVGGAKNGGCVKNEMNNPINSSTIVTDPVYRIPLQNEGMDIAEALRMHVLC